MQNKKQKLAQFLDDVADGKYGDCSLNSFHGFHYMNVATEQNLDELDEFYESFTAAQKNNDAADMNALVIHINSVLNSN